MSAHLERAHAAIARADATLAQPRAEGEPWQVPATRTPSAAAEPITVDHLRSIAQITGKAIRDHVAPLEARIAELEDLLTRPAA